MRTVAVETVLDHIRMFIKKWPPLLCMALDTGLLDTVLKQVVVSKSSMGVVAVNTEYPSFLEGVMAWQGKLGLCRLMATEAKIA